MDEPTKTKLLDRATTEATQYLTRIHTQEQREELAARRAKDDLQERLRTQADQFVLNNDLDGLQDFFNKNQSQMDANDRMRFLKVIRRQDIVTDFTTFANLNERAASGENVESDARQAVAQGKLSDSDYRVVVNASRETGWRKRGSTYITNSIKPSAFEQSTSDAKIRAANALRDWDRWARDNPGATDVQADSESKRIVEEYSKNQQVNSRNTLRRPRYLAADPRGEPDLTLASRKTKEAYEKGEISESEYKNQAELLKQWRVIYQAEQAQREAAARRRSQREQ